MSRKPVISVSLPAIRFSFKTTTLSTADNSLFLADKAILYAKLELV